MAQISDFTIEQIENGNYVVKTTGVYQDIDFVNGGFITTQQRAEEIRDLIIQQSIPPTLESVKQTKLNELSQVCQNAITGGFNSTAYQNTDKIYDSTLEDQANITGNALSAMSKLANTPGCENDKFYYHASGEEFTEWTPEETLALARDFKVFKEQQLLRNSQLQAYVETLATTEEVQTVTWDTVIPT